jgi:hypothetical protein
MPKEEAEPSRQELASGFVETIRVSNVYNRLVTFDAYLKHAAHDYFGNDDSNSRLTIIFFVKKLFADHTPISRHKLIG